MTRLAGRRKPLLSSRPPPLDKLIAFAHWRTAPFPAAPARSVWHDPSLNVQVHHVISFSFLVLPLDGLFPMPTAVPPASP